MKNFKFSSSIKFLRKKPLTNPVLKINNFQKKQLFNQFFLKNWLNNKIHINYLLTELIKKIYFIKYISKIKYNKIIIRKKLNSNFFFKNFKFKLIFFKRIWSIVDFYQIPNKLKFNQFFLESKFFKNLLLKKIKTIDFSLNNFYSLIFFEYKKTKNLFFKNGLFLNYFLKLLVIGQSRNIIPSLVNYKNLFFKNGLTFYKNSYLSYWSFINISLYLTWSFFYQFNIPSTGLDLWNLVNFNTIFFRFGDIPLKKTPYEMFIWDIRNFFDWKGIPYTTIHRNFTRNNFLSLPGLDFQFIINDLKKCPSSDFWFFNEIIINFIKKI